MAWRARRVIQHERAVNLISTQAEWDDDTWRLKPLENTLTKRPHSTKGLRRPETEYARHRAQYDPDTRYKAENIVLLDLENIERTTQDYAGRTCGATARSFWRRRSTRRMCMSEGSGPLIEVVDEEPVARPRTGRRRGAALGRGGRRAGWGPLCPTARARGRAGRFLRANVKGVFFSNRDVVPSRAKRKCRSDSAAICMGSRR